MPTRRNEDAGVTERRCPGCRVWFPMDADHFYVRPSTGRPERCTTCHRDYYRARSANRASRRAAGGTGTGRRFGIEFEFIGDRQAVAEQMRARGLEVTVESYNHRTRRHWKIVSDSSAEWELVSPPLRGEAGRRQVELACEAMQAAGARVNGTCGTHVHHDVRDLDGRSFARLFRAWMEQQTAIDQLVEPGRRHDGAHAHWCRPLSSSVVLRIEGIVAGQSLAHDVRRSLSRIDRYFALNVTSFPKYGTVEARQHGGTINAQKILAWVDLGQAMISLARSERDVAGNDCAHGLLDELAVHGIPAASAEYLRGRATRFGFPRPAMAMAMAV